MSGPAISVVLPTHNGHSFIDQSIESVVKQTWQDWELIIVDDASTDDTPAVIDRWAARDPRITAVHLPKNRMLPGALNEGFARARGAFHTWTSDDNWYHPQALARMLDVLEKKADVAIVHADRVDVDEFGSPIEVCPAGPAEQLHVMNNIGACFLYRCEVTAALNGYDEDLFGAEDYDFWLRAAIRFRYHRLPEVLYFYRLQGNSLSARKYHLIARNVERAVRRWLPQMAWPSPRERLQAYLEWGVRCLRAGTWEEIYEPWLSQADWIDEETRRQTRREVLKRAVELAWEAHWRRDWTDFKRLKAYLAEIGDEPEAARLLQAHFYPAWVYRAKDRFCAVTRRLRCWYRRLAPANL